MVAAVVWNWGGANTERKQGREGAAAEVGNVACRQEKEPQYGRCLCRYMQGSKGMCERAGLFVWMHHITCMCVSIVKSWETRPVFAPLCGFFARRLTGHQQPQREGISRTTGLVGLPIRVIRVSRWDEVGGQDER